MKKSLGAILKIPLEEAEKHWPPQEWFFSHLG